MASKNYATGPVYIWVLLGLVLVVGILSLAKAFIVPLALAVLLAFVLNPVVSALQRLGFWRVPAVLLTVALALSAFLAVGWGVGMQVHALVKQLPEHKERIKAKIADLHGSGEGAFANFLRMIREISEDPEKMVAPGSDAAALQRQIVVAQPEATSSFEKLVLVILPVFEPLATTGLVIILVIFMLSSREDLRNRLIGLLGHGHMTGTTRVIVDTANRLSSFLLTQLLINVAFGTAFGIGLLVIGVPYAFLWGFLTSLLRFVPYIGTWISVAFPLTLSFALSPDWTQPVVVLVFFALMDLIVGNAVEPLLFGHRIGVTPIALLIAAAFWTWIWGAIGLVLSTPLTVCLVVLGKHVPRFKFFALLLGDKPPLETHVSYYQRLLSRDVGEAKRLVSDYAKTHGPENVFDDVLIPALVLAQLDRKQEGFSTEDEEFIFQETTEILAQLEAEPASASPTGSQSPLRSHQDAQAALLPALVLSCPAHQKAEELPLRMLGLLMKTDGVQVEVLSTKALPAEVGERIAKVEPAVVFIAVLPPGGLVQVRYLCKLLRKRFGGLPLVIGYWGPPRNYDRLLVHLRSAGATYVTTSLLQTQSRIRALLNPASPREPVKASRSHGGPETVESTGT